MKLSDLPRVGELKKSLDYLDTLRNALNAPTQAKVKIDGIDLRPEIAARAVGSIEAAVLVERAAIRAQLADLGVVAV